MDRNSSASPNHVLLKKNTPTTSPTSNQSKPLSSRLYPLATTCSHPSSQPPPSGTSTTYWSCSDIFQSCQLLCACNVTDHPILSLLLSGLCLCSFLCMLFFLYSTPSSQVLHKGFTCSGLLCALASVALILRRGSGKCLFICILCWEYNLLEDEALSYLTRCPIRC